MSHTKFFQKVCLVFAALLLHGIVEAGVQRVDYCNARFTPPAMVPVVKGSGSAVMVVRGDFTDLTTGVTAPSGITVAIGNKSGGGGLNTSVQLTVTVGSSVGTGAKTIKLDPGIGAFNINVLNAPSITSIAVVPASPIQEGTQVTITATGSGLANVRYSDRRTSGAISNIQNVTTGNGTTFAFRGNAVRSVSINASDFFDSQITTQGGIDEGCARAVGSGTLSYTVGRPDLVTSKPTKVYRLSAVDSCDGQTLAVTKDDFCTSPIGTPMPNPTTAQPRVEQVKNVGGIVYIITNPTDFPITGSFIVQLKVGINVLKEDTVNGLGAKDHKVLGFSRPVNTRLLMRHLNCPKCYDLNRAPHNWVDPQYTVVVDAGNQIPEGNENNNTTLSD